jgi:mitochondrial import inner membrane translocase subunit TIM22
MVLSGTLGFAMGGAFGLFMSSMRYDSPLATMNNPALPAGKSITDLPVREQLRLGLKDMGRTSLSSAKNFGRIGAMYSMTECVIEGLRGKSDLWNGISAGGVTGGILARAGGPQAVMIGALGFAAFSGAIDAYMRSGDSEKKFPVI